MGGCIGVRLEGAERCLAHVDPKVLKAFLAGLTSGANVDLRGTQVTASLLDQLLAAVRASNGLPRLGVVQCERVQFHGDAQFDQAQFSEDVDFTEAEFLGSARFRKAAFNGPVSFGAAVFHDSAWFEGARFGDEALFGMARFTGLASFSDVRFGNSTAFRRAQFTRDASFLGAKFGGTAFFDFAELNGKAEFTDAQFNAVTKFSETHFRGPVFFDKAQFTKEAAFDKTRFDGEVSFGTSWFRGTASFDQAIMNGPTWFNETRFAGFASFKSTNFAGISFDDVFFGGPTEFSWARFDHTASFDRALFARAVSFDNAQFGESVSFNQAQFGGTAWFDKARFKQPGRFGPLLTTVRLSLDQAVVEGATLIEAVSPELSCVGARFAETVTFRLRYAQIVMDGTVFSRPSTIAFARDTFKEASAFGEVNIFDETLLRADRRAAQPRLLSLRRVDTSTLTVSDLDLSACLFAGAHHLDQLRIEGPRPFADTPRGWQFGRVGGQGLFVWRWTHRQTLAEEHRWRAGLPLASTASGRPHPKRAGCCPPRCQVPGWVAERSGQQVERLYPDHLASLYRALRKAQEDNKNEPGAADFYYGEMEMRRKAHAATPWGERVVLALYWLISGYGLRGLRALACLAAVVMVLAIMFKHVGFYHVDPPFWDSLIYTAQSAISLESKNVGLMNRLSQAGEVLRVVVRLTGPVLLALALLSVRNRVKR